MDNEAENAIMNAKLSQHVLDDGYAMITTTKLRGHVVLRMCPIYPETAMVFLDKTFDLMNA